MRKNGKLARVLTAMVTPFDQNLNVDYQKAAELAKRLVATGSDGLVVAGTTGESPTLSNEEKLKLFKTVREAVGDSALVLAGTGSNCTKSTIELTKAAEDTGVDGVMLVTPYYNKPPQAGMYKHFGDVAKATKLPILLYNVPGRTSCNMLPDTICKLGDDFENIVAVKEASGMLDSVAEIRSKAKKDFIIYSGDDNLTLPVMAVGGDGIVSVASHVAGLMMQEMITAFLAKDTLKAAEMHRKLLPLFKVIFISTNPIPIKAAMGLVGLPCGSLRPPLVDISNADLEAVKVVMKSLSLI